MSHCGVRSVLYTRAAHFKCTMYDKGSQCLGLGTSVPVPVRALSQSPCVKFDPGLFYTYFYNHAHRPRLEKPLYIIPRNF
jgi:hypothetical protein